MHAKQADRFFGMLQRHPRLMGIFAMLHLRWSFRRSVRSSEVRSTSEFRSRTSMPIHGDHEPITSADQSDIQALSRYAEQARVALAADDLPWSKAVAVSVPWSLRRCAVRYPPHKPLRLIRSYYRRT